MKYAVNSNLMKAMDQYTIHSIGIPSMVLMERAALAVADSIAQNRSKQDLIAVVSGSGNNGADGIAVARILFSRGFSVELIFVGNQERMTAECEQQMAIAKNLGLSLRTECNFVEYNVIVDSIIGIGLSRNVSEALFGVIEQINTAREKGSYVISVDVPTGVNADDGQIMGTTVQADETITFQTMKLGLLLYPGAKYAGRVKTVDIGVYDKIENISTPSTRNQKLVWASFFEKKDLTRIPKRKAYSNKGTYGKVLIIAGSEFITGAAYLSALAAYRMGVGMVKILTAALAIPVLQSLLPEALVAAYDGEEAQEVLTDSLQWASSVVVGPGLSTSKRSKKLVFSVIDWMKASQSEKALVLDADGLNVMAAYLNEQVGEIDEKAIIRSRISKLKEVLPLNTVLTPHLVELSRLILYPANKIPSNLIDISQQSTYNNELTYVLKDTRTIVTSKDQIYLNVSGNHGMATGGSGDVLSGIIGGFLALGLQKLEAATLGVYVHGLAGDVACEKLGAHSMLARDIIEALPEVLKQYEG